DVLQPQPEATGDVDAGLDGEDVPRLHRRVVARDDVRVLMGLDTDPMAGAVHEVRPEAGGGDDPASGVVDLGRWAPRSHRAYRGFLRLLQHRVRVPNLAAGLPHREHARDVRAVPVLRPAEVTEDDVTRTDRPRRRIVVGTGSVLAGGHDR